MSLMSPPAHKSRAKKCKIYTKSPCKKCPYFTRKIQNIQILIKLLRYGIGVSCDKGHGMPCPYEVVVFVADNNAMKTTYEVVWVGGEVKLRFLVLGEV